MRQDNTKAFRLRLIRMGRRKKQSGELSLIEAGAYMAGAALLAIAVIKGGAYVYNLIKTQQFTSEAQMFHTGMLNATQTTRISRRRRCRIWHKTAHSMRRAHGCPATRPVCAASSDNR